MIEIPEDDVGDNVLEQATDVFREPEDYGRSNNLCLEDMFAEGTEKEGLKQQTQTQEMDSGDEAIIDVPNDDDHELFEDYIYVWASGVKISELEQNVNTYLTVMSRFLWENLRLISAPRSSVTFFTPDPAQTNTRPKINFTDLELSLVRSHNILRVYPDTFFSFNNYSVQVGNRVSKRNNVLKALAVTNWGPKKETLLMT